MLFFILAKLTFGLSQMIKSPSPYDENGCCLSCGYTWCETLNECVRVWETYCQSLDNGH